MKYIILYIYIYKLQIIHGLITLLIFYTIIIVKLLIERKHEYL